MPRRTMAIACRQKERPDERLTLTECHMLLPNNMNVLYECFGGAERFKEECSEMRSQSG